ncbi:amidohydrolase family protein [Pseudoalteromonas sp. T1lg88]|uniref:amidohydrolase family protein n=1 Tax=Pseudoalteromonas sp. T1lg88 TaxID=2077104 RepID=UPI000CF6E2F5|nr:amidohydrolase family protein [Pseudoalteromonas sp. T1lg88]
MVVIRRSNESVAALMEKPLATPMAKSMTTPVFDPHVHFFAYGRGDYYWLKQQGPPFWPQKQCIQRDFAMADLILGHGLELKGVAHIEAGFDNQHPAKELDWLQELGFRGPAISYAAIDQAPEQFAASLQRLKFPLLRGIRDITEGLDGERLLSPNVGKNLTLLCEQGLLFEAQFSLCEPELAAAVVAHAKANPRLNIVINHAGLVTPATWDTWLEGLSLCAGCDNIYLKCCGWEITHPDGDINWQQKVIRTAILHLGFQRVMLASNFPLCLFKTSYQQLWLDYQAMDLPHFSALACVNAQRLYGTETRTPDA